MMTTAKPKEVKHLTKSNEIQLRYQDMSSSLSAEFLRVHSPSAEVRQHGNPLLISGKASVQILKIEAVGRYGIKITFDDGHDTGIFSWTYLRALSEEQESMWHTYLQKLHQADKSRDPETQVVKIHPPGHGTS